MKRNSLAARRVAKFVVVALFLTGCATTSDGEPIVYQEGELAAALRTETYTSLRDLAEDSEMVVVATYTGGTVERDPIGFRFVPMMIEEVLSGSARVGEELVVRSDIPYPGDDSRSVLMSKRAFMLFLTPLDYGDGRTYDEWSVVGWVAGYLERREGGVFHVIDPDSNLSSDRFTTGEVIEAVSRS